MKMIIEGPDSNYRVRNVNIGECLLQKRLVLEDDTEMPVGYLRMRWHRLEEEPCLMGDDVYFAKQGDKAWYTFDGWVYEIDYTDSLESLARILALEPEKLDQYRKDYDDKQLPTAD